jgi:hypothetical protein
MEPWPGFDVEAAKGELGDIAGGHDISEIIVR